LGVLGKLGQKPLFARTLVSPLVTTGDQEKPQFTPVMCPLCARSVPEMTLGIRWGYLQRQTISPHSRQLGLPSFDH